VATSVRRSRPAVRGVAVVVNLLLALGVLVVLVPLAVMLFATMGFSAITGAGIVGLMLACAWCLSPQLEIVTNGERYGPAGLALGVFAGLLAWGAVATRYNVGTPRVINVAYVLDADARTAAWTARSDRVIPWLEQFFGKTPADGRPRAYVPAWSTATGIPDYRHAPAPVVDLAQPSVTLIGTTTSAEGRVLRLKVVPAAEGHAVSVWVDGASVVDAKIDGRVVKQAAGAGPAARNWTLDYVNAPADGFELSLDFRGQGKAAVAVLDRTFGLPAAAGRITERPADVVPEGLGDLTVVRRDYRF